MTTFEIEGRTYAVIPLAELEALRAVKQGEPLTVEQVVKAMPTQRRRNILLNAIDNTGRKRAKETGVSLDSIVNAETFRALSMLRGVGMHAALEFDETFRGVK